MGHTAKMKELVMLLVPHHAYSNGETLHKLSELNKQSSIPLPEPANYQKDKLLILIEIASMPLGSSVIWRYYENKGVFSHALGSQSEWAAKKQSSHCYFLTF